MEGKGMRRLFERRRGKRKKGKAREKEDLWQLKKNGCMKVRGIEEG